MMRGQGGQWVPPRQVPTGRQPMDPDASWAEEEFGEADLGDVRRNARLIQLASVLGAQPSASLPDATYLDWTDHPNTTGLGPLAAPTHQGLLAHTTLAITPERVPLGLLAQQVWARDKDVRRNQDHKQRPINDKESQKWLRSLDAVIAARAACPDTQFVSVGDREADVYDLFLRERPLGVDLLVRAAQDRKADHPERYLWAAMASAPIAATVTIQLGKRGRQLARKAALSVRWRQVTLRPPNSRTKEKLPSITVWAVWAIETN